MGELVNEIVREYGYIATGPKYYANRAASGKEE